METFAARQTETEPYAVVETEENTFRFITDHNNEYQIVFSEYWQQDLVSLYTRSQLPVYEFYFEVMAKRQSGMDKRIAHTIFSVVDLFLERSKGLIFYITQRDDGRSKELFKVYQFWYNQYKEKRGEHLQKIDKVVAYEDTVEAYLSCLFMKTTLPDKVKASQMIDEILNEIYPNASIKAF